MSGGGITRGWETSMAITRKHFFEGIKFRDIMLKHLEQRYNHGRGLRFKRDKDARNWQCIFWQNPHKGRKPLQKKENKDHIFYVSSYEIHASKAIKKN